MQIIDMGVGIINSREHKVTTIKFLSDYTFIDADIIFWNVVSTNDEIKAHSLGGISAHNRIKKLIESRSADLKEFFSLGGFLVITNSQFEEITFPGVDAVFNLSEVLDLAKVPIKKKKGKNLTSNGDKKVEDYLKNNQIFHYSYEFTQPIGRILMFIKKSKYVLSQFVKKQNGGVLFLPTIAANTFDDPTTNETFISTTIDLCKYLGKVSGGENFNIVPPEWVINYKVQEEVELNKTISIIKKDIEVINKKLNTKNNELEEIEKLKRLFWCDGKPLEQIIQKIISDVGGEVKNPENNRDDLIITFDDKVAVVEIKGVKKSAAEHHAAQLEKWVSIYFGDNGVQPKGILIVNAYKEEPLDERNGESFPKQMLPYSEQREHCLITGIQLFCLYYDYKKGNISNAEFFSKLFNTVGELKYTPNPVDILNKC